MSKIRAGSAYMLTKTQISDIEFVETVVKTTFYSIFWFWIRLL